MARGRRAIAPWTAASRRTNRAGIQSAGGLESLRCTWVPLALGVGHGPVGQPHRVVGELQGELARTARWASRAVKEKPSRHRVNAGDLDASVQPDCLARNRASGVAPSG